LIYYEINWIKVEKIRSKFNIVKSNNIKPKNISVEYEIYRYMYIYIQTRITIKTKFKFCLCGKAYSTAL